MARLWRYARQQPNTTQNSEAAKARGARYAVRIKKGIGCESRAGRSAATRTHRGPCEANPLPYAQSVGFIPEEVWMKVCHPQGEGKADAWKLPFRMREPEE
jgi:hypothetical protein